MARFVSFVVIISILASNAHQSLLDNDGNIEDKFISVPSAKEASKYMNDYTVSYDMFLHIYTTYLLLMLYPIPSCIYNLPEAHLKYLTSEEHMAGTKGDLKMADYVHRKFQSYGLINSVIEEMPATLSFPKAEPPSLELIDVSKSADTPTILFKAALAEKILPEDHTSDSWLRNHTFLGYSPSGEVMESVVYANFGRPEDFDALEKLGVNVKGKIVLVRYGKCFRGLKVRG